ncbi:MAG TPA: NPCBM/NEW2 domain-containing protein [Planctomycetaceae bacterium]|jgi:sRNA-binding regulator protein Hfq|nr:NPCBM/NEW2 domain-containing protein [Planctomycetaceae bacterium]
MIWFRRWSPDRVRWACQVLLFGLTAASVARAADPGAATIYLADGSRKVGVIRSLSVSELVLDREPAERLATADIVRLEFANRSLPPPRASLIQLANGDRIVAGLSSMSDESVVALWKSYPDLPPVQISASAVAGILVSVPEGVADKTRAFRDVFGRRDKSDTVLLVNGDRLAGDLTSFDQAALKLSQGGKLLQIELPRVRGISFSSDLTSLPAAHKPRIEVTLGDGSQLTGWNASREAGGPLRLSSLLVSTLELPLADVAAIRFLDGRTTYLSDLQPTESRLAPYFGSATTAAPGHDQSAAGGPLLVRGVSYPKGLGTRSSSRIVYQLGAQFRAFQATAAIDDYARGKGSLRFAVEVDGTRAWTGDLVTGSSRPMVVGPIDVSGKQTLALLVEYGELADVDDWADWCDAVVIR